MSQDIPTSAPSRTLKAVLAERGALPPKVGLALFGQLLVQVRALHASGATHRAVGLETVLLDATDRATLAAAEPVRELDRADAASDSCPPELAGAGVVRLPAGIEAARRELARAGVALDPRRIDVYQLGALLCQLLTGQAVSAYLRSPKTKSRVPVPLQPLIDRALGHNPSERFADCDAYAGALEAVGREAPAAALETPPGGREIASPPPTPATGADSPSSPSPLPSRDLPFTQLGHYRILRRIGHGGMGDVFLGFEEALQRPVAIKVLPAELTRSEDFIRRFRAEATAVARLEHPNIVPIYFIGQGAGYHYFAMQFVEGESLDRRLARCGRLGVDETLAVLEQCLAGLGAAHRAGLVHRDVKPGNVLLEADGGRALVADFGLVKVASAHSGVTTTGVVMGTVDYIPPEQARAEEVDGRSDLYSVGVMAYRMLSGRLPFEAKTPTAMLFKHAYETPKPLGEAAPDVPRALAALVDKLMAKDPAARCQTCEAAAADVRRFRADAQAVSLAPRPSQIVQAPDFGRPPVLDAGLQTPAPGNWWRRVCDRVADLFQAHAPEFVKELQSTTQQVDGALAEYQRRRDRLASLVGEAQQVIEGLAAQAKSNREAAIVAARRADSASGEQAAHQAAKEKEDCERSAADLERQVVEQRGELEQMRSNLVKTDAMLGRLRVQRDLLKGRLRVAEARLNLEGGRRRRLLPLAFGLVLLAAALAVVGLFFFRSAPTAPDNAAGPPAAVTLPDPVALANRLSAADALRREDIPAAALAWAGLGDARNAPAELVGILGDARFRLLGGTCFPAYSPDGKLLAVASGSQVMIFDAESGQYRRTLVGHTSQARVVAFSPDGQMLASSSRDRTVKLWDVAAGREIRTLCGHTGEVQCLAFSPDGQTLASGATDHTVRLWQVATGEQRRVWQGHAENAWWHLAFDPKGGLLAAGAENGAVAVWDVAGGILRSEYRHALPSDTQVVFSPDGKVLASGNDVEVKLFDASTFKEKNTIQTPASGLLAFAPDGRALLTGLHFNPAGVIPTVKRWEPDVGKELAALKLEDEQGWIHYRLSPDGKTLAAASYEQRVVHLYDAVTGRPSFPAVGHTREVVRVAFSPDGKTLASGSMDRTVKLWNVAAGKEVRTLSGHTDQVWYVTFSPDGKVLASGGVDQTVILWDAASGQRLRLLFGPTSAVEQIAFSPDGRLLAGASDDHIVYLWDVASGREVKTFRGHANQVHGVAFSPDSETLASGDVDGALKLWDVASAKEKRSLQLASGIQRLVFFPDGQTLAAAEQGGEVSLWSPATGVKQQTLTPPASTWVDALSVRADGRMVAGCGKEGTVRLWDLTAAAPAGQVWRLMPRFSWVDTVAFSPEGRYLAAGADDGTIRIFRAPEHVPAEPPPAPCAPFRVDLNALAGRQSMDATSFPPLWRREGVFAEVNGPGEAKFPGIAATRYICELELEVLRIKDSHLRILTGEAEIHLEWDEKAERVQCKLLNWHGGSGGIWGDGCRYNLAERLRFKLVVVDGRRGLLVNNAPCLEGGGSPTDLGLRILSEGRPFATVYRCSCRAVEDDDLRALNWPLLPARSTLDPDVAAKRLRETTAGLDDKPVEGKRFVVGATGGPLTWIAPGEFDLGSRNPQTPEGHRKHHVRLTKGFWMGQYEVTQGEWAKLMPGNPSRFAGSPFFPVDSVSRVDALRFCKQLTDGEKAAGRVPEGYEYRLPTEAEWEYAGRAGSDEEFSVSPDQIWCLETSTQQPHEVGAFPPNTWGLYDMQGNVQEWCYDGWGNYPKPEAGSVENPAPLGNSANGEFVVRGGAWWLSRGACGISARTFSVSGAGAYLGFRIVLGPAIRPGIR